MADIATDSIGLGYRINLAQLATTIKGAKSQLAKFHKDLAALSKMASVTITVHDKKAKAQVKQFANAVQASLDKAGRLQIKAVAEPFAKIGGAVPRITKDYEKLYGLFGQSPALLGKMNASFKRVNNAIGEQAVRMQSAGRNGIGYYKTANRISLVQQELKGTLRATATGFRNVALETKKAEAAKAKAATDKAYARKLKEEAMAANQLAVAQAKTAKATVTPSAELRKMGITSATTTKQFHRMNFEVADHAKIAKLTGLQMKELEGSMASSGKATATQAHQFNRLNKRLEHSQYQVRKQTSAMGDARRAQERWGAGFKYMMLSQMAWIASGAVIFGTIQGISQALRDFLDFNQGLVDAAAITQATASGYERLEKAAMNAFKSSTMGAREATEALKILGQAGMDATDAAIALETIYKVTTATGGDTTSVVKFLTTAINVWKLSAEDAAKVGNILGAALNYSKLEVEDLGVTFNYVASMAKTVGMSITELAAVMAVMANAGIKASTIGTGLRGVMSKLISGSGKLDKELVKLEKRTGVKLTFEDISLSSNTLMESLEKLSKAGFDLANIFTGLRRREAAALNVMLEQGVDRFNLMAEALKDTTAIEVMFERSMKGMKNQLILTGHQIQAVLIDALKVSEPIIIGVAKSIQALVSALRDLSSVLIVLGGILAGWNIVAALTATSAAKVAAGFTATATASVVAAKASGILNKAWKLLSKHPIITGLTLLIGGYAAVKAIIDATSESTEELIGKNNREIDDLRKLQVLMVDVNRTDKDKLLILADYAKQYDGLLPLLDQQNVSLDKTLKLIKQEIGLRDSATIAAYRQQLAIKKMLLSPVETRHWLMKFALVTGPTEEGLKKLQEEVDLLETKIGILAGDIEAPKLLSDLGLKFTADMREALDKLEYEASSAREQAMVDLKKSLSDFRITETTKTELLATHIKKRKEINAKAQEEIAAEKAKPSIDPVANKAILTERDKALASLDEQLRAQELLISVYNAKILEINKEFADKAKKQRDKEKAYIKEITKRDKEALKVLDDLKKKYYGKEWEYRKESQKNALSDADFKEWLADEEFKREEEKLAKTIKLYEDHYDNLKLMYADLPEAEIEFAQIEAFIAKLKALKPVRRKEEEPIDPSDYARGILDGLKEVGEELRNEYKTWKDLTKETAYAMRDTLSDVFFDSMMGQLKTAGDYWRAFTTSVKRMIADMAAKWVMLQAFKGAAGGIDWLGTVLSVGSMAAGAGGGGGGGGGEVTTAYTGEVHEGGLIKKMHSGGLASNETLRILKDKEFVIRDSSVRSIGVAPLNYANQTGRLPQAQAPQQVVNKNYYYVYAIDSESMDVALRKRGAGAISDISLNANAHARMRRDPRATGRR